MARIEQRPTRRTRAKRGDEPKLSIDDRLLGAMERLLEKGHRFGALSVEQLTEEAGIARGTFYLHFRDKGELVARLMSHVTDELIQATGIWMSDAEATTVRDMQLGLTAMVRSFKKHQAILSAINDMAATDEKVAALYREMVDTICARSRKSLAAVKRQGRSRPGATDEVADALSWMVVMYCTRFVGERDGAALDRLAKSVGYICAATVFADAS